MWQLPLIERYHKWMDSEIADDLWRPRGTTASGTRQLIDLALNFTPPRA
jgi:hypothetical protein